MKEHRIAEGSFALTGKDFIGDALDPPFLVGPHRLPKHATGELSRLADDATDRLGICRRCDAIHDDRSDR
jgi:hypothetical protein